MATHPHHSQAVIHQAESYSCNRHSEE